MSHGGLKLVFVSAPPPFCLSPAPLHSSAENFGLSGMVLKAHCPMSPVRWGRGGEAPAKLGIPSPPGVCTGTPPSGLCVHGEQAFLPGTWARIFVLRAENGDTKIHFSARCWGRRCECLTNCPLVRVHTWFPSSSLRTWEAGPL